MPLFLSGCFYAVLFGNADETSNVTVEDDPSSDTGGGAGGAGGEESELGLNTFQFVGATVDGTFQYTWVDSGSGGDIYFAICMTSGCIPTVGDPDTAVQFVPESWESYSISVNELETVTVKVWLEHPVLGTLGTPVFFNDEVVPLIGISGTSTASDSASVSVYWTADSALNTGYRAELCQGQTCDFSTVEDFQLLAESASGVTFSALTSGTYYKVRVKRLHADSVNDSPYWESTSLFTVPDPVIGSASWFSGSREGPGYRDGTAVEARYNMPSGIVKVGSYLYVADGMNHAIRRVSTVDGSVTTFSGRLGEPGMTDGSAVASRYVDPSGLASDGTYLYVLHSREHSGGAIKRVSLADGSSANFSLVAAGGARAITVSGGYLYVLRLEGLARIDLSDDSVTYYTFTLSFGPVAMTAVGTDLYYSDYNLIKKLDTSSGTITTVAGNSTSGWEDGIGPDANLSFQIEGIAYDGTDYIYFTDNIWGDLRRYKISDSTVELVAGNHTLGIDDGTGSAGQFSYPKGIVHEAGTLYIADHTSIRQVGSLSSVGGGGGGVVSRLSGLGYFWDSHSELNDGPAAAARFQSPGSIVEKDGYFFVADHIWGVAQIRKVNATTGEVTTLATVDSYPTLAIAGDFIYSASSTGAQNQRVHLGTGVVDTLVGTGTPGTLDGGAPSVSGFSIVGATVQNINGMAIYNGKLYFNQGADCVLRELNLTTLQVTTVVGVVSDCASTDGTGTAARLGWNGKIALHGSRLLYYTPIENSVRQINLNTFEVSPLFPIVSNFAVSSIFTSGNNLYGASFGRLYRLNLTTGYSERIVGAEPFALQSGSQGVTDGEGAQAQLVFIGGGVAIGDSLMVTDSGHSGFAHLGGYNLRKIDCKRNGASLSCGAD